MHAIILAGGKGERLRPMTDHKPKPMVEVAGKPILEYQVEWLRAEGVTSVAVSCGYRHEVIQQYFGNGAKWGLEMHYAVESTPLGRGGGIKKALATLSESSLLDPVVVTNGDIITDLRLASVLSQHVVTGAIATVVLAPFHSPYGVVEIDSRDRILGFKEKPELPYWVNGGIYLLDREVYEYLPDVGDIEDETFPRLANDGRLAAYRYRGFWRTIDTAKDLATVGEELRRAQAA